MTMPTNTKPVPAAAIVHTKGRKGLRLIPIQAIDFYRGVAALPLLHNQER